MHAILDNTVLSNFALVEKSELLHAVLGNVAATTFQVIEEFAVGVERNLVPATDWTWLPVLTLMPEEKGLYDQLLRRLNAGEASCIAIAAHRQSRVLTDDRDARRIARQMAIPVSGTIGVLVRLVHVQLLELEAGNTLLKRMIAQGYRAPIEMLDDLL